MVVQAPAPAVAMGEATELIAYIQTMGHAWNEPGEETWSAPPLYASGALLALKAADDLVFRGLSP